MKILVVEDEAKVAKAMTRGLVHAGHQVDACTSGEDAAVQAEAVGYDAIVLDWSLPDIDGVALLRRWRARGLATPVLMVTGRSDVGERITGLRAGADDFMTKPFDFGELLARLEALHRRAAGAYRTCALGSVRLDVSRRVVARGGREETLTGREWALASALLGHAGEVLTRSELLSKVWGSTFDGTPNVVDVYVGYLRAKLNALGADDVAIEAVRGIGFRAAAKRAAT